MKTKTTLEVSHAELESRIYQMFLDRGTSLSRVNLDKALADYDSRYRKSGCPLFNLKASESLFVTCGEDKLREVERRGGLEKAGDLMFVLYQLIKDERLPDHDLLLVHSESADSSSLDVKIERAANQEPVFIIEYSRLEVLIKQMFQKRGVEFSVDLPSDLSDLDPSWTNGSTHLFDIKADDPEWESLSCRRIASLEDRGKIACNADLAIALHQLVENERIPEGKILVMVDW